MENNENIIRIKIEDLINEITFYIKKEFNVNISHQSTSCDVFYEDKLEENLIIIDDEDHVYYDKTVFGLCRFDGYYKNDSLFKIFINNKDASLSDSLKIVDFLKNKYNQLKFEIKIFRNKDWFRLKSFIEMNEYNEKNDYVFCIDISFTKDFLLYCKNEEDHNNYKYIIISGNRYDNIIAYHDKFITPSGGGGNVRCYPKPHTIEHLYHECNKHNHNHIFYILINPREIKIQENIIDYEYDYAFKITGDGDFKLFKKDCIEILENFKEFFKNDKKSITIECALEFPEKNYIFLKDINNELKKIKINMLGIKKGE